MMEQTWCELRLRALGAEATRDVVTLDTRFASLYETSFPASERTAIQDLADGLESGLRSLYVAELLFESEAAELSAFVITCDIGCRDVVLGEYLATAPKRRRSGVGGSLFRFVVAHLGQRGADVIFEVEPPMEGDNPVERMERVRFYQGMGASVVTCAAEYKMPNLEQPGATMPMTLWWATGRRERPPCGPKLRNCIRGIYRNSYALTDDDPLISGVLSTLPCG